MHNTMTRQELPCWLLVPLLLLATGTYAAAANAAANADTDYASPRHLQLLQAEIVDATANYVSSSESIFDHEVDLEDNLSFHWNDITGDHFNGRLVHIADSLEQAPSWLAVGLYHSNHNYTILPISNFMVGSDAIIGMTQTPSDIPDFEHVQRYHLGGKSWLRS
jgi:hypothetical protein